MYSEKDWVKTLCNAFELPVVNWLPPSIADLLTHLLVNPSREIEGDVLFLMIEEDMTTAQLLAVLPGRGEIIAEYPVVFQHSTRSFTDNLTFFLQEKLVPYAADHGVYDNGSWSLKHVLLKTADNCTNDVKAIIDKYLGDVSVITVDKNPQTIINELPASIHTRNIFNSVLMIYPKHFYIEKSGPGSAISQLELIPYASENFVLNINQRYKIFSFATDSEYNLADSSKNLLRVKLYEKNFIDSKSEIAAEPNLILEHVHKLNNNDNVINIYLNLPLKCLEVDYTYGNSSSATHDDVLQDLQKQQQAGYDFISGLHLIDPQIISDYDQHLKHGQNEILSSHYISQTVYYKALTLLSVLSAKK